MLITVIVLLIILIIFIIKISEKKPKTEAITSIIGTKAFEKVMQKHKVVDHRFDDALLRSIRFAMTNEVFDFEEVKNKPDSPTFEHLTHLRQNFQDAIIGGQSEEEMITSLLAKLEPQDINDFVINEIHQKLKSYATANQDYERSRDFCTNFLLEIGLISEEQFSVDGTNILAYRTILNDAISFRHSGTGVELTNQKFSFSENSQIRGYNEVSYFEQVLVKILRENALYLERKKDKIFAAVHALKPPTTLSTSENKDELKHIHRVYYALNQRIKRAAPFETPKPDFASIQCDFKINRWTASKDDLNRLIQLYHELLPACESNDSNKMESILCEFERENFLLSADTIMLSKSIADNSAQLLAKLGDLEEDVSSQIGNLSDELDSQLQSVKNSAQAATAAATTAAIQATRVHNKLK